MTLNPLKLQKKTFIQKMIFLSILIIILKTLLLCFVLYSLYAGLIEYDYSITVAETVGEVIGNFLFLTPLQALIPAGIWQLFTPKKIEEQSEKSSKKSSKK